MPVLLLLGGRAAADGVHSVPASDALVYTLGGGGESAPRDGLPASAADLDAASSLTPRPDGSVALLVGPRRPFVIDLDGRLHALPAIQEDGNVASIAALSAQPNGTLLAATRRFVHRLVPGVPGWQPWFPLGRIPGWRRYALVTQLVGLPDGFAFDAFDFGAWRVGADGQSTRIRVPARSDGLALLALPGSRLGARLSEDPLAIRERVISIASDGTRSTLATFPGPERTPSTLLALADGNFVRVSDHLERIASDGTIVDIGGRRPGLGAGHGGPTARALLAGEELAETADGALLIGGATPLAGGRTRLDREAERRRGRLLTGTDEDDARVLRIVASPTTRRPLVAMTPATYETLSAGRVVFTSTFAGRATLQVVRRGRVVTRAEIDAHPGVNEIALPTPPAHADLRLALTIISPDGRSSTARLAATTVRRLSRVRALRLVERIAASMTDGDSEAYFATEIAGCQRRSGTSIACRAIRVSGGPGIRERRRCDGVFTVTLRPDGVRAIHRYGARACRALQ